MELNTKIIEIYNNKNIYNQLKSIDNKTASILNKDEKDNIKLNTIWKCLLKFNGEKSSFSTYLYRSYINNLRKASKKSKELQIPDNFNYYYYEKENIDTTNLIKFLSDSEKLIIEDRFYKNMSLRQIGEKYGFSFQWARIKINKILKKIKLRNLEYNSMDRIHSGL